MFIVFDTEIHNAMYAAESVIKQFSRVGLPYYGFVQNGIAIFHQHASIAALRKASKELARRLEGGGWKVELEEGWTVPRIVVRRTCNSLIDIPPERAKFLEKAKNARKTEKEPGRLACK